MIMENDNRKITDPQTEQDDSVVEDKDKTTEDPVPTGRRKSFSNIRRQMTDEELSSPGVQKLLIDMLEESESECENLKNYVSSYHVADKRAAILGERLTKDNKIDIFFGVGVGLGGAILGLIPFFSDDKPLYGVVCGFVGFALVIGATIGRIKK